MEFTNAVVDVDEWEDWNEEKLASSLDKLQLPKTSETSSKQRMVKGRGAVKFTSNSVEETLGAELPYPLDKASGGPQEATYNSQLELHEHILEVFGFSSSIKTTDLEKLLEPYRSTGYRIKWVDESHTLVIFRSALYAQEALRLLKHPTVRLRPFSEACIESKSALFQRESSFSANSVTSCDIPRPETTNVVARRIIGNVLQIPELQRTKDLNLQKRTQKKTKSQNNYWDS